MRSPHGGASLVANILRIRMLQADPDLGSFLTPEERREAAALTIPVETLDPGPLDLDDLLHLHLAFGAFVVDGMLACHLRIGEQAGMRLLGPGDLLTGSGQASMLLADRGCRVVTPTRIAILGRDALVGVHRWPRLLAGLHVRATEQIERVAVQLAICQLPRVEDRLLALLWLLAESWGRVTPSGTSLPISLTHGTLGALIGARRPTVTLALGELAERGAVLRQGRAWLLLERPAVAEGPARPPHTPELLLDVPSIWAAIADTKDAPTREARAEVAATVERLREEHKSNAALVRERLVRVRASNERSRELRDRVRSERRVSPPPAPSSR
jgi:CRP/FNR family cyclic AMP-dependent transcriptional regulator